jgi:hypothetical protein
LAFFTARFDRANGNPHPSQVTISVSHISLSLRFSPVPERDFFPFIPSVMFFQPCALMLDSTKEDLAFVVFNLVRGFLAFTSAVLAGYFY